MTQSNNHSPKSFSSRTQVASRQNKDCFVIDFDKHMLFCSSDKLEEAIIDRLYNLVSKKFFQKPRSIIVVGIGNEQIVEDSFGPRVSARINVGVIGKTIVSALTPDVSGKTNLDTFKLIHGVFSEFTPDLAIFVDTLSTKNHKRIASSIQISKSSLVPGSGLGEKGKSFSSKYLKTKSISVGMPFVKFFDKDGEKYMTTLADIDVIVYQSAVLVSRALNEFIAKNHK